MILLTVVMIIMSMPAAAFAASAPIGLGTFNTIDPGLIDPSLVLLKTPPTIPAQNIHVGEDVAINYTDSGYAYTLTDVKLNGKSIPNNATGYYAYTSFMGFTYLTIDSSNFNTAGTYTLTLEEAGYFDAECTIQVTLKKPPTLSAKDIKVGEKAVILATETNYASAVTKIVGPVFTTYTTADGEISISGGDITINPPASVAGSFPLKIIAYGYEDASITVNVIGNTIVTPTSAAVTTIAAVTSTAPAITGMTVNQTQLPSVGGYVTFTLTGTNLKQASSIIVDSNGKQAQAILPITSNDTVMIGLTLPANSTAQEQVYKFHPILNGITQKISTTVKVAANTATAADPFQMGKADTWAQPEVNNASSLDLLPDILSGKDLTKPMTREEFCELSVRLYEKMTGKQASPADTDTFSDTSNSQVLKAYALGITSGTSATTFDPNVQINREQCAAMLYRTIKLVKPNGNYDVSNVKAFPDMKNISSWAVDATKYMNQIAIIKGDSQGNFMPRPITADQLNSGYGMAKREETILMVVRTYSQLSD
jgi:hypothetical protein